MENLSDTEKAKGYYRRGQAHALTKQDDEAEKDLSQADSLFGGKDPALRSDLEKIRLRKKRNARRRRRHLEASLHKCEAL